MVVTRPTFMQQSLGPVPGIILLMFVPWRGIAFMHCVLEGEGLYITAYAK